MDFDLFVIGGGSAGVSDKEIWSIAAFVKKLPTVSDTVTRRGARRRRDAGACQRSRGSVGFASLSTRMTTDHRTPISWGAGMRRSSSSIAPTGHRRFAPIMGSVCVN